MKNLEIATILGARLIEKHFTFDKSLKGNDHYHSMDKNDLIIFRNRLEKLLPILGNGSFEDMTNQLSARQHARRSLVVNRTLKKGSYIKKSDLTWKRPASGISPKDIDMVLNSVTKTKIKSDTVLTAGLIEKGRD